MLADKHQYQIFAKSKIVRSMYKKQKNNLNPCNVNTKWFERRLLIVYNMGHVLVINYLFPNLLKRS
jgi:hypothetical protein